MSKWCAFPLICIKTGRQRASATEPVAGHANLIAYRQTDFCGVLMMRAVPVLMRSVWILALRAVLAIVFGIAALAVPALTTLTLISFFAIYAILLGSVAVVGALRNRNSSDDWWLLLAFGLLSLLAGVLATMHPFLTVLMLVTLIGVHAIVTGIVDIVLALRLRRFLAGEWLLMLSAVFAICFGFLVLLYPAASALVLVWMVGVYALLSGIFLLALAYRASLDSEPMSTPITPGKLRLERRIGERRMSSAGHR